MKTYHIYFTNQRRIKLNFKHIKRIKFVLDALNENYPPKKIHTLLRNGFGLRKSTIIEDKYFTANVDLFSSKLTWNIVCTNYWVWQESESYLKKFCKVLSEEFNCSVLSCYSHPVYIGQIKDKAKMGEMLFLGTCNWKK